jgi:hypothetical protein
MLAPMMPLDTRFAKYVPVENALRPSKAEQVAVDVHPQWVQGCYGRSNLRDGTQIDDAPGPDSEDEEDYGPQRKLKPNPKSSDEYSPGERWTDNSLCAIHTALHSTLLPLCDGAGNPTTRQISGFNKTNGSIPTTLCNDLDDWKAFHAKRGRSVGPWYPVY